MLTATPSDWQAQLAADPAHAAWSDARQAEDQRAFDAWLGSPEGRAWLAAEERAEETRRYPYGRPDQDTGWFWERPAIPALSILGPLLITLRAAKIQ